MSTRTRHRSSQGAVDHLLSRPDPRAAAPPPPLAQEAAVVQRKVQAVPRRPLSVPAAPPTAQLAPPPPPAAGEEDHGSIMNEVFSVAWEIAASTPDMSGPTLVRQSSNLTDAVDWPFWQAVRALADACRTGEDWQRLLAVLLGISLDPAMNKNPIYMFTVAPNPAHAHGLRASRPARRRPPPAEGAESHKRAAARHEARAERLAKRARLRALIGGAPPQHEREMQELALWLLDDSEACDAENKAEREALAEEMEVATFKLMVAAKQYAKRAADAAREDEERKAALRGKDDETVEAEGTAEDVVRSAKEAGGSAATGKVKGGPGAEGGDGSGGGGGGGSGGGGGVGGGGASDMDSELRRVDDAEKTAQLSELCALLGSRWEEVGVKAALAIASLCARDERLQAELASLGGMGKMVALLDRERKLSEEGLLDVVLAFKALAANRMHHPELLRQLVEAEGPRKLVGLLGSGAAGNGNNGGGGGGGGDRDRVLALLEIIRSLGGAPVARDSLRGAGVIPRLLRLLGPSAPARYVEPAAATVAVMVRDDADCCEAMLHAQGAAALVPLLAHPSSAAAVSAASALGALAVLGQPGRLGARDAGALEALLPLLDGAFGDHDAEEAAAAAAAAALASLSRDSPVTARELSELGGLQTLVGMLGLRGRRPATLVGACEAVEAVAAADGACASELVRVGAVARLTGLLSDGSASVAAAAAAALTLLSEGISDPAIARKVRERLAADGGLGELVAQLKRPSGAEVARAALLLDGVALSDADQRARIVELGAVPLLVEAMRKGLDAGAVGPHGTALLNALGLLEALAQGSPPVQEAARRAGALPQLVRTLALRLPEGGGAAAAAAADELRRNAALASATLVAAHKAAIADARAAGLVEALVGLLDGGAEDEAAVLGIMGLKALGLRELGQQERAVRALSTLAGGTAAAADERLAVHRVAALKAVWAMESLASPAKRAARSGFAAAGQRGGGGGGDKAAVAGATSSASSKRRSLGAGRRRSLFG